MSETAAPASLRPLEDLETRLGARRGRLDDGGPELVLSYGSVADEHRALVSGCAWLDRSHSGRLEIAGADRLRFVNAYVTCDVKSLAPGQVTYGFFTNPQGRILADASFLALEDRLWVELPPGQEEAIAAHLKKYLIADRVTIAPLSSHLPLALSGPGAGAVLEAGGAAAVPDGPYGPATLFEHDAILAWAERPGLPSWTLWVAPESAASLAERLIAAGAVPAGWEAHEAARVERGIPRCGRDFGPQSFPQETGIDEAVSYTKGCYLGQEVVARIHYRGGVQKTLCGLAFARLPAAGTALSLEGREVGAATTVVDSPALGRPIGLGILHKRGAEPGMRLTLPDGTTAEVTPLPFV